MKGLTHVFASLVLLSFLTGCGGGPAIATPQLTSTLQPSAASAPTVTQGQPTPLLTEQPATGAAPTAGPPTPSTASNIAQVWANEGGDKVTREELRATYNPNAVHNSVWDGTTVYLFGARNEVVAFNLVLEAPAAEATGVTMSLASLTASNGASITTRPASGEDVFNYVGRNIELFYVRYLEIRGLSVDLAYEAYDERHIPQRCRRPYDPETGEGRGGWEDRPCHNVLYPDIAVPLEFHTPFSIPAGTNQSIWGDIYIPKTTPPGAYTGMIEIAENGVTTWQIPIRLQVRNFALPDLPSARTMVYQDKEDINDRYFGEPYPEPGTPLYTQSLALADRHFQLAHKHKFSLIDEGDIGPEQMDEAWTDRLSGKLFTPARGYDGVGVGVGNNVYSIGTYGSWHWQDGDRQDMWTNTNAWVEWFEAQSFATPTEYFLYLIDESEDYDQTERWAQWMDENPGPGRRLPSMATIALPAAVEHTSSLHVPTGGYWIGPTDAWQNAAEAIRADPTKRLYMYNGHRPGSGSFATEDEGVALRMVPWGQFKMNVARWFYWESTYYINFQCRDYEYDDPRAYTNFFESAHTFGCYDSDDESLGEAGRQRWDYFNGDGVLFYPGSDYHYPEASYGVLGPFASLRLKHWRRGIQDFDYLTLAAQVAPQRVAEIVKTMVPEILWEVGVDDFSDPTWLRVYTDISWSVDPDEWEAARAELADIIEGGIP